MSWGLRAQIEELRDEVRKLEELNDELRDELDRNEDELIDLRADLERAKRALDKANKS